MECLLGSDRFFFRGHFHKPEPQGFFLCLEHTDRKTTTIEEEIINCTSRSMFKIIS